MASLHPVPTVQMVEKQLCDPSSLIHVTLILRVGYVNPTDSHTPLVIAASVFSATLGIDISYSIQHFLLHLEVPQKVLVNVI